MIWHIFRKDWKLLRRPVVAVGVVNIAYAMLLGRIFSSEGTNSQVGGVVQIFGFLSVVAVGFLLVLAVQQDPIPGVRQDWLARPIRRRDLMLSKVLFALLLVQCPIFLGEVCQCFAAGLSPAQALGAPLSRSLWMFLAFDLPLMALATLTGSLMEAFAVALTVTVGVVTLEVSIRGGWNTSAIAWVTDATQILWGLLAATTVLALQYLRRHTTRARWLWGAGAAAWVMIELLPWQAAFAVQERLPLAADSQSVKLMYDPATARPDPFHVTADSSSADAIVYVPLHVDGAGNDGMLVADRATARVTRADGRVFDLGSVNLTTFRDHRQLVFIPQRVYAGARDQTLRLELDYSLSLLHSEPVRTISLGLVRQRVEGLGACALKIDPRYALRTEHPMPVELGCTVAGVPPCVIWGVDDALTGEQIGGNQDRGCVRDYAPYFGRLETGSIRGFPDGASTFLMGPQEMNHLRARFRVYRPVAHFTRQVVVPDIRLSEWTAR